MFDVKIATENLVFAALIAYSIAAGIAVVCYLPKIVGFFRALSVSPRLSAKSSRRICVIIPARNESKTISPLFQSLIKQTYPDEFYDICVVVKEENDPTLVMAANIGAFVTVVKNQSCKGDALDGFFKELPKERFMSYDAFVIVDADAILADDYLEELNNALESDADIFVSRKYNKNCYLGDRRSRSLFSNCAALLWPLLDDLGGRWKEENGIPLNICGQGMAVRRSVIEKIGGWPFRTLTEDYELRLYSILDEFKSVYCPHAVLYTEEALSHKENMSRRMRWLTGYSQGDLKYREQIRKRVKERGKMTAAEGDYFYGRIPVLLFIAATAITMLLGIGFGIGMALAKNSLWTLPFLLLTVLPFSIMYFLLLLYSVLGYFVGRQIFAFVSMGEIVAMLLMQPIYLLEFCPIFVRARYRVMKGRAKEWEETKRVNYFD